MLFHFRTDVREQNGYLVFEDNVLELFKTCLQCRLPAAGHISQRSWSYIANKQTWSVATHGGGSHSQTSKKFQLGISNSVQQYCLLAAHLQKC
ncbi:hypothetical protein DPMN_006485 [Dreissena polymorpha]|uniref:Uncharacterized protein n=1 Tax=Dreissena polymorpha TaxID=45954 RepID=A0A9D4MVE0_DREPO|nr:hypothetical protein DPMN_006485 [Dreissena polymorpha]